MGKRRSKKKFDPDSVPPYEDRIAGLLDDVITSVALIDKRFIRIDMLKSEIRTLVENTIDSIKADALIDSDESEFMQHIFAIWGEIPILPKSVTGLLKKLIGSTYIEYLDEEKFNIGFRHIFNFISQTDRDGHCIDAALAWDLILDFVGDELVYDSEIRDKVRAVIARFKGG